MLDIKWITENKELFKKHMKSRGVSVDVEQLIEEYKNINLLQKNFEELKRKKNILAKKIGSFKNKDSDEFKNLLKEAKQISNNLSQFNSINEIKEVFYDKLSSYPNILDKSVPLGKDENDNLLIRKWGEIPEISNPKPHYIIGENLGMLDFEQTAKISGSRYVTFKDKLAKLERALISFMLDYLTSQKDFTEVSPPYIVKDKAMYNAGQLPKFSEDSYKVEGGMRLIPTAEVPLTNLVSESIIPVEELPIKMASFTPCFRSEAGSAGRDTKGIIRLHQFSKVEMVIISSKKDSEDLHEFLTDSAENILKLLKLPYRVMLLCSGDTGFSAAKTYDIEVWLPSENKYREISSCSNCLDFQARRLKARYKELKAKNTNLVHTLNGSGLAVGRTMVAIIENYQLKDGSIKIPDILVKYMGGETIIK